MIPASKLHNPKQKEYYILVGRELQDEMLNPDVIFQINTLRNNFTSRIDNMETKLDKLIEAMAQKNQP